MLIAIHFVIDSNVVVVEDSSSSSSEYETDDDYTVSSNEIENTPETNESEKEKADGKSKYLFEKNYNKSFYVQNHLMNEI